MLFDLSDSPRSNPNRKKSRVIKVILAAFAIFKNKIFLGFLAGVVAVLAGNSAVEYTSTDHFCEACHVHPHSTELWKKSTHYRNKSGVVVHCVDCHLPPEGVYYLTEKAETGARDVYGKLFKDISKIDWEAKSKLEHAIRYTYNESCIRCHVDLFGVGLSKKGEDAHIHWLRNKEQVKCINCHLTVGHYHEKKVEEVFAASTPIEGKTLAPAKPVVADVFENYTEYIPSTYVKFDLIAVPGGQFVMGSVKSEPYRQEDEGPPVRVRISPFWMGKTEVTWDEWEIFYAQTATRGKNEIASLSPVDAITGPTPPYGSPDQGWGKGSRPALTMTHHAAMKYCEWLSLVTGKKFRLPTEAEWEYACRAGTSGAYFFPSDPKKLSSKSLMNKLFGADTSTINRYVWYDANGAWKTHPAMTKQPNPWGLYDMLGNVREFCLDYYGPDAYSANTADTVIVDPKGPETGDENVIRGGSYESDATQLRCADRDFTRHDDWLITDPQSPKSIWWYSDVKNVGFRVVREFEGKVNAGK